MKENLIRNSYLSSFNISDKGLQDLIIINTKCLIDDKVHGLDKEDFFILNKEETSTYSLYNSITLADELAIDLNNVTIALEDRLSTATKATTSTADIENNDFILNQPKEERGLISNNESKLIKLDLF